jgi:hypothetical protein
MSDGSFMLPIPELTEKEDAEAGRVLSLEEARHFIKEWRAR